MKLIIEVDIPDVIGHGDAHFEMWCDKLADMFHAAEHGSSDYLFLPHGVRLLGSNPNLALAVAERMGAAVKTED